MGGRKSAGCGRREDRFRSLPPHLVLCDFRGVICPRCASSVTWQHGAEECPCSAHCRYLGNGSCPCASFFKAAGSEKGCTFVVFRFRGGQSQEGGARVHEAGELWELGSQKCVSVEQILGCGACGAGLRRNRAAV